MDGGPGADTINGGDGIDRALYTNSPTGTGHHDRRVPTTPTAPGQRARTSATDVESITGGNGNDPITGSCFANTLAGQGGNDTLNGDTSRLAVGGGDFMGGGLGETR